MRGLQARVHVLDILDALALEPLAKRLPALLAIDRDPILPGRTAAQHSREAGAGLGRQFERLGELRVADAGRQIDERTGGDTRRAAEVIHRLLLRVRLLAAE